MKIWFIVMNILTSACFYLSNPEKWISGRHSIINRFLLFFLFFYLMFSPSLSVADQSSEFETLTRFLLDIKNQLDQQEASKNISYNDILIRACDFPDDDGMLEADIIEEQRDQKLRDKGLELRGGLSSGDFSSSDDEDGVFDGGKGYLELSWNILKNGYLDNKSDAVTLNLLARKTELLAAQKSLIQQFKCQDNGIKKDFAGLRVNALGLKAKLMEQVFKVERRAYFKQWSYLDDYLVSEQDLVLTRQELNTLLDDPYYDDAALSDLPPIITVDLQGVLEAVRNDDNETAILNLEKDYLEKKADSSFQDSLRLYLRKDIVKSDTYGGSDDLVAGLRFTIPIKKRDKGIASLKLSKLEQETRFDQYERLYLCRAAHEELMSQLRRTIRQYYQHQKAKERLRRSLITLNSEEEQSLTVAITRMKTQIDAWLELISATEELYRRVNRLFLVARIPYSSSLVSEVGLVPELERARPGQRTVYIWSDDFNRLSNKDIIDFLEAKQITAVLLSGSNRTDTDKRDAFIKLLSAKNIRVELIIGDNSWIFKDKQKHAVEKTVVTAESAELIHFDIEPQAMDGYRTNKTDYIDLFLELVTKVKEGMLDRQLTVAVPFHWTAPVYQKLGDLADRLYIMAYGTDVPDVLLRRISPALKGTGPDKLVVVLRPKDFKDEWAMEKFISIIQEQTGIERFGFHDIGQFISLSGPSNETEN
jgi:hypothetical protein